MAEKHLPVKRNPLMQKATPLAFDNVSEEELLELTDEQKSDRFLSRWMELVHPFSAFPKVFKTDGEGKKILREIKNFHKRYVLVDGWTEQKYVLVINAVLDARGQVGPATIERFGKMYDNEALPAQVRARRAERKNR